MNQLERVARALCWANGMDPDLTLGGDGVNFLWMEYEHQAQAAIDAVSVDSKLLSQLYETARSQRNE